MAFQQYTNVVTNNAHATATAVADTHATGTAIANTTAPADTHATATAFAATVTATAYVPLYQYRSMGTLAFTDQLSDPNSRGRGVCNDDNDPQTYSNFVFEVNMTINQGDCGGMAIRNDESTGKVYIFEICSDGQYFFYKFASNNGSDASQLQHQDSSSAINTGNQSNWIAIVAKDSNFDLYVNGQPIDSISDYGYSQGKVGLFAFDVKNATTVTFQNATLRTL